MCSDACLCLYFVNAYTCICACMCVHMSFLCANELIQVIMHEYVRALGFVHLHEYQMQN